MSGIKVRSPHSQIRSICAGQDFETWLKPCQTFPKSPLPAPCAQKPHFISQKCPWEQQYHQYHPFETPQVQNKSLCAGQKVEMWLKPCLLFRKVLFKPSWAQKTHHISQKCPWVQQYCQYKQFQTLLVQSKSFCDGRDVETWLKPCFPEKSRFNTLSPTTPLYQSEMSPFSPASPKNLSCQPCMGEKSKIFCTPIWPPEVSHGTMVIFRKATWKCHLWWSYSWQLYHNR